VATTPQQINNQNKVQDKYFHITGDSDAYDNTLLQHIDYFDVIDKESACMSSVGIKKSLHRHVSFWDSISAYESVLRIIRSGYDIPFISNPPSMCMSNNQSALRNYSFVSTSIQELLLSECIVEVPFQPFFVSPLSVAENKNKKRLILDLSILNTFIKKEHIKFEDWKVALEYFRKNCYCIKFDLRSGYHHIDVSPKSQTYLGFSWFGKFYCFTVLPFGLTTAPYVFTKCLRPIVKYFRENFIDIVLYLDDGLAMSDSISDCKNMSTFIQNTLEKAGFQINFEKSVFHPSQTLEWLGLIWNSEEYSLSIPCRRIDDLKISLEFVLKTMPNVTARQLAKVTGKIISLSPVFGNVCSIMTRYCYMKIMSRLSWDSVLNPERNEDVLKELHFWLSNIYVSNTKKLCGVFEKDVIVYSDASNVAAGAYTVELNQKVFHLMWKEHEANKSSTWRELRAIEQTLICFQDDFTAKTLKWFTDNQACVKIVQSGSMKLELQNLALNIFSVCVNKGITLDIQWIPRQENTIADYISNIIDYEDWGVTDDFFQFMNKLWGPYTIDRFASSHNKKLERFNSLFWNPGSESVDCFCQNWRNENNWLVPPVNLIIKTIKFLVNSNARGTLIVPKWSSSPFWTFIFGKNLSYRDYVQDVIEFKNTENIFQQGLNKNSIFGSNFRASVLAVKLDAENI
jgi:hypothetical protein